MATPLIIPIAQISLLAAAAAALDVPPSPHDQALSMAAREMQHASYFSFVILAKMVRDKLPSNATFLVPSDRMLSRVDVPHDKVMEFLLRHSIPALLLFDDLEHLPSGTLNSAQLVLPNVCTAGLSFRCHGIMGVMQVTSPEIDAPSNCTVQVPRPPAAPIEPSPAPVLPTPSPPALPSQVTASSPSPAAFEHKPKKSSSNAINFSMLCAAIVPFLVFSMVNHLL